MIHRMSRNIFQRDDVVNWNHVPEMCEEFADACGPMQLVYEIGLKFFKKPQRDEPNVLVLTVRWQSVWSVDPWWMLAQASCCARLLVASRWWSYHRQRAEDVTRVPVTKSIRQRAAAISETTSRRRIPRRLLRKSNTMPHIGGRACGFRVFCGVDRDSLHSVANNAIVLQQARAA